MTKNEIKVLNFMRKMNGSIPREIAKENFLTPDETKLILKSLVDSGYLKKKEILHGHYFYKINESK